MAWLFPFEKIEKNSTIVLFGAGSVGYEFYCQLTHSGYCKEVIWVDSQYEWYQYIGLPVKSPNVIKELQFDNIVISVERVSAYNSIFDFLVKLGMPLEKIIWKADYFYENNLKINNEKYNHNEINHVFELDAINLVDENRMDIVIRYMYAMSILNNNYENRHLYSKLIQSINGAKEPLNNGIYAYFSHYNKKETIEDFDNSFVNLVNSMKNEGFKKEFFIPIGKDLKPVNGAHRIAAALALGIKVWAVKYAQIEGTSMCYRYNKDWLMNNNFNEAEIADILNTYTILKLQYF